MHLFLFFSLSCTVSSMVIKHQYNTKSSTLLSPLLDVADEKETCLLIHHTYTLSSVDTSSSPEVFLQLSKWLSQASEPAIWKSIKLQQGGGGSHFVAYSEMPGGDSYSIGLSIKGASSTVEIRKIELLFSSCTDIIGTSSPTAQSREHLTSTSIILLHLHLSNNTAYLFDNSVKYFQLIMLHNQWMVSNLHIYHF